MNMTKIGLLSSMLLFCVNGFANLDRLAEKLLGWKQLEVSINGETHNGWSSFYYLHNKKTIAEKFQFPYKGDTIEGTAFIQYSELYNRYELTQFDNFSKSSITLFSDSVMQ